MHRTQFLDIDLKLIYLAFTGPIKKVYATVSKSQRKYNGDVTKVTDCCRGFLVAKDIATLLAIIEYVLSSCGECVKRIKLSSLRPGDNALEGGYRDCKINVDVDGHICEIQVHLENFWSVAKVDGYHVYKNCVEEPTTTSFNDPFRSLIGLNVGQLDDIIAAAAEDGINMQSWGPFQDAKDARAYFALAGLLLQAEEEKEAKAIQGKIFELKMRVPDVEAKSLDLMYEYLQEKIHGSNGAWTQESLLSMIPDEFMNSANIVASCTACTEVGQDTKDIELAKEVWLKRRSKMFEALLKCDPADKSLAALTEGKSLWLAPYRYHY